MITFVSKLSNGTQLEVTDFCFRALGQTYVSRVFPGYENINEKNAYHEMVHWFPFQSTTHDADGMYTEEQLRNIFKEVIDAFPFIKSITKIHNHPVDGELCVSVMAGDVPCDKTMGALTFLRNVFYTDDFHNTYAYCREMELTPKAAIMFASLFYLHQNYRGEKVFYRRGTNSDYSNVNPETFGKRAFENLITHDKDWNPWLQGTWKDQKKYLSEDTTNAIFNGANGPSRQSLRDCFSIEEEELLFPHLPEATEFTLHEVCDAIQGLFTEFGVDFFEL